MRVFVTEPVHADALDLLEAAGAHILRRWELAPSERTAALATAEAAIVRTAPFGAEVIAAAPRLRHIAKHGVGVDNIDLGAARARGVAVTNTPEANAISVAEHALALLLALAKRLPAQDATVRAGGWSADAPRPLELHGLKLAVLGYGRSGRRLAALAAALGMEVAVLSRALPAGQLPEGHRVAATLGEALAGAQAVSVHLPLTEETRGMIGAAELALLAPGALVVNVARGGIVDDAALAADPRLMGYALDVFAVEPPGSDHPALSDPRALLSAHVAGVTDAALRRMGMEAAGAVLAFAEGRLDPALRLV